MILSDKQSSPFECRTKNPKAAKKIYDLSTGNHEMYVRRRRPDTLDVQQMRDQKREEAEQRASEREALKREIKAREEMEKSREETLAKYTALKAEMEKYKLDLEEARRTIDDLTRQLSETQVRSPHFHSF